MGNKTSTVPVSNNAKEMVEPQRLTQQLNSVLSLDELSEMCSKLEEHVHKMSMAISNVIFNENRNYSTAKPTSAGAAVVVKFKDGKTAVDFSEESVEISKTESEDEQINTKFQGMTRLIQNLIHELIVQLDHHSKQVTSSTSSNNKLMTCVISVVSNVNSYMAMLIRNIRKLGRLLSEGGSGISVVQQRHLKEYPVVDVVGDTQDIDAMLMELRGTEKEREELENDVISVLIIYKEFKGLTKELDGMSTSIEDNVKQAALSIDCGYSRKVIKS